MHSDSAVIADASPRGAAKRLAMLRAMAALAAVRVDPIQADGGQSAYIVTRWNLTKRCNSIDELTEFLRQMGIEE